MSLPDVNAALGGMLRNVLSTVRTTVLSTQDNDPVDRALAAVALAAGAVALAWPAGRKAPQWVSAGAGAAQQVWRRRAWFIPEARPAAIRGASRP